MSNGLNLTPSHKQAGGVHMKNDHEVKLYMSERRKGSSQRLAAARAGMSERTARTVVELLSCSTARPRIHRSFDFSFHSVHHNLNLTLPTLLPADSPVQRSNFAHDHADTPETYSPPTNL